MDAPSKAALDLRLGSSDWLRAAHRARRLAALSLAWLCFEGTATTTAGTLAGSVALIGNGLDGAIEGLASVIVVWRFSGSRTLSTTSERRAQQLVALSFFLLAPYIAFEANRSPKDAAPGAAQAADAPSHALHAPSAGTSRSFQALIAKSA